MAEPSIGLTRQTAAALAAMVREGVLRPEAVVRACLDRIRALDGSVGAFQLVREERALVEAEKLARRPDLHQLPLAGVPIAIKDNLPVAGEPTRMGSPVTPSAPASEDHEVVRRVRAAGAIVIGKTRLPELGIWPMTDGAFGSALNPWHLFRSSGGSSGGSAAAVASAMVPIAVGNDGLGSIRIPAACCGLVGLKPGPGVVPSGVGVHSWFGLAENGPLATTVEDAALLFTVMAGAKPWKPEAAPGPLRVALSTRSPAAGVPVDAEWVRATEATASLLGGAGHVVVHADPPYPLRYVPAMLGNWFAGALRDAEGLPLGRLEPRTRRHIALGRIAQRIGLTDRRHRDGWRRAHERFFERFDLLLTPTLARPPLDAGPWSRRSWTANFFSSTRYAPFCGPWNFAGFPAMAVPAGVHSDSTPLSVQLVALPGKETLLLSVAAQMERLRPWARHAPI